MLQLIIIIIIILFTKVVNIEVPEGSFISEDKNYNNYNNNDDDNNHSSS